MAIVAAVIVFAAFIGKAMQESKRQAAPLEREIERKLRELRAHEEIVSR